MMVSAENRLAKGHSKEILLIWGGGVSKIGRIRLEMMGSAENILVKGHSEEIMLIWGGGISKIGRIRLKMMGTLYLI